MKSILLSPLTNRDASGAFVLPADGWYRIAPLGEFPVELTLDNAGKNAFGTASPVAIQVIDDAAVKAIANQAAKSDRELLIDFEHFSHDPEKSTEAAGWIQKLEARDDGLYMQPRWSDSGEAALKGGRYRFISPTWFPDQCKVVGMAADGRTPKIRPVVLNDAGLTNNPNLKGLQPLSNRSADPAAAATQTNQNKVNYKEQLIQLLGLPADATDEQIAAACTGASDKMAKGTEAAALTNRLTAVQTDLANADLDMLGITDEEERKEVRPFLIQNRKGALALMKNRGTEEKSARKPLTNRETAKTPGAKATDEPSEEQLAKDNARAAVIRNRAAEIQKHERISYTAAFSRAEREVAA